MLSLRRFNYMIRSMINISRPKVYLKSTIFYDHLNFHTQLSETHQTGKPNKNGKKSRYNQIKEHVMTEEFSLKEKDVGITEFVCNERGFIGIIRHRISDFHVNEIDMSENVAKLTNMCVPEPVRDEKNTPVDKDTLVNLITEKKFNELKEMTVKNEVQIDVTGFDKIKRTIIHNTITEMFERVTSQTFNYDAKTFIRCTKTNKNQLQQTIKLWRDKYTYFILYMEHLDTIAATRQLAQHLNGIRAGSIKYAGIKDKRAITTQWACIRGVDPLIIANAAERLPNVFVGNFTFKDEPLQLGTLKGNRFRIAVRHINENESVVNEQLTNFKKNGFINYYGLQRFGIHVTPPTHDIGLALLRGQYQEACELILKPREHDLSYMVPVRKCWWKTRNAHLAVKQLRSERGKNNDAILLLLGFVNNGPNDYIKALAGIPLNMRLMYIQAYQSLIWNQMASRRIQTFGLNIHIGDLVYIDGVTDIIDKSKYKSGDNLEDNVNEKVSRLQDMVKHVTESDITSSKYNIFDVLLPKPGHHVLYPANECGKWYEERLRWDELSSEKFGQEERCVTTGSYRKLIAKPMNLSWCLMNYKNDTDVLIQSDLEEMENVPKPVSNNGPLKALVLDFCLPKSTYATMALREILKTNTSRGYQSRLYKDLQKIV